MAAEHWSPVTIKVEDVEAYGPYPAEVEVNHSLTHVWEAPRFTAEAVTALITDHAAVTRGIDPREEVAITWDGSDVIVTFGSIMVGNGPDGPAEVERVHPDADGRYRLPLDWNWSIHRPEQSYQLPEPAPLAAALDAAHEQGENEDGEASPHLARVVCTVLAAAVRDILTEFDHDAPFDAVGLALYVRDNGTVSVPAGTYWTASGQVRHIEDAHDLHGLAEWTAYLSVDNFADGWGPLCTAVNPGADPFATIYRLDLTAAAHLPGDEH